MERLQGSENQYLKGAFPSHSLFPKLSDNFKNISQKNLEEVLEAGEFLSPQGKPTKKAGRLGLVDAFQGQAFWNLKVVQEVLGEAGLKLERQAVNQELKIPTNGEPVWVNLGVLGSYFSVSAKVVGQWLDDLGLRDQEGMANQEALDRGLGTYFEMATGQGKKTRRVSNWNLHLTQEVLVKAGHLLDFDYEKTLKGTGRNSDVKIVTVDERAREFAKEFVKLFKERSRERLLNLVKGAPTPVQRKAEELLKRPGFITSGNYLKYL